MIPKIIHYVWLGSKEKSDLIKKCIASWKKFCPDYEIIEWNDEKIKHLKNNYLKQALETKKYAFASDYIRLYALKKYGGIYLDSDVEITSNIDKFLTHNFFSGYELYNNNVLPIMTALIGCEAENEIISTFLEYYNDAKFILPNKKLNLTPNTITVAKILSNKYNVKEPFDSSKIIKLKENSIIYPHWYFCTPEDKKENYSIHHFNGSWKKKKIKLLDNKFIYKEKKGNKRIIHIGFIKISYKKKG